MKKIVVSMCAFCLFATGCAGWKLLTPAEKYAKVHDYYSVFMVGLKATTALMPSTVQPKVNAVLAVADATVSALDAKIAANASEKELAEASSAAGAAVRAANAVVGES